ncbi:MAG: hypothetical protein ACRC38_06665, partial [Plesiomonas sp.]
MNRGAGKPEISKKPAKLTVCIKYSQFALFHSLNKPTKYVRLHKIIFVCNTDLLALLTLMLA